MESCLIKIQNAHVKPGPKHKPRNGNSYLLRQVWDSLVHLRVQGPNSMAQVHAGIKQHFDIEQIVHT